MVFRLTCSFVRITTMMIIIVKNTGLSHRCTNTVVHRSDASMEKMERTRVQMGTTFDDDKRVSFSKSGKHKKEEKTSKKNCVTLYHFIFKAEATVWP